MRSFTSIFVLAFFLACFSATVSADPIVITSGTASTTFNLSNPTNTFNLSGGGGSAFSGMSIGGFGGTQNPISFAGGSSFTPTFDIFKTITSSPVYFLNFNGTYQSGGINTPITYLGGPFGSSVIFTAQNALTLPSSAIATFTTQIPFSVQGTLIGLSQCSGIPNCTQTQYTTAVTGTGNATYNFTYNNGRYDLSSANYTFATPEPTPEPATLILMGTGIAGIFGFAKRRKSSRRGELPN